MSVAKLVLTGQEPDDPGARVRRALATAAQAASEDAKRLLDAVEQLRDHAAAILVVAEAYPVGVVDEARALATALEGPALRLRRTLGG